MILKQVLYISAKGAKRICVVCFSVLLLALVAPFNHPLQAQSRQLCFDVPRISNCITGRFLEYWEQNGGLAVFGYPITPAHPEENRDTGETYLTQWFERNRFELHPDEARPYDVLLGRLGEDRLLQQNRDWNQFPKGAPTSDCLWFSVTGHSVCNLGRNLGFKRYWETHGLLDPALSAYQRSLALFGLPLSEPVVETNSAGDTVVAQWFERARFEWHPANPDEFKVLLGLLGSEVSRQPQTTVLDNNAGAVTIPWQGREVRVVERPIQNLAPSSGDEIEPQRTIANFEVVNASNGDEIIRSFEPPIQLEARFTAEDYAKATQTNCGSVDCTLTLGYWDNEIQHWIAFNAEKHQYELHFDAGCDIAKPPYACPGTGIVNIREWGDPHIAWGQRK